MKWNADSKVLNAARHSGKVKWGEDALSYQKQRLEKAKAGIARGEYLSNEQAEEYEYIEGKLIDHAFDKREESLIDGLKGALFLKYGV